MKITTSTILAASLLIGGFAKAQTTPPARSFGTGELPEFLKAYDLDGDGKLSVEERQAFEKACREAKPARPDIKNPWDTNGDGVMSDAEKQAARDAIAAKMNDERTKRFNELDVNQDGLLSAEELTKIPGITPEMITRMIEHLDTDKDGSISKAEFLAVLKPVAPPPIPPVPDMLTRPLPFPFPLGGINVPSPLITFDSDKNGKLSEAEFIAMMTALNTDGVPGVSPEEWKTYILAHPEVLTPPPAPPTGGDTQLPPPGA